jgi:hypothetical protein
MHDEGNINGFVINQSPFPNPKFTLNQTLNYFDLKLTSNQTRNPNLRSLKSILKYIILYWKLIDGKLVGIKFINLQSKLSKKTRIKFLIDFNTTTITYAEISKL